VNPSALVVARFAISRDLNNPASTDSLRRLAADVDRGYSRPDKGERTPSFTRDQNGVDHVTTRWRVETTQPGVTY